jgi:hypothetical protein
VDETMQPESLTLWLKPTSSPSPLSQREPGRIGGEV